MSHVDSVTDGIGFTEGNAGLISDSSGTTVQALELLRDEKRKMLAANRATWWALADLDAQAVAQHGSQVISDLAADEQCSEAHIKQRLSLRDAFGEIRQTLVKVNFSVLRAVLNASKRTGRDAHDLLSLAVNASWHVSDLDALGKDETAGKRQFKGDCEDCALQVSVTARKVSTVERGVTLRCPNCATYLGSLG